MKTKHIIIALAALAISFNAQAQEVTFGLKGGLSAYWIPGTIITGFETSIIPHNAFYGGISTTFEFGGAMVAQAELIYSGKGHSDRAQYGSNLGKYSNNLHYIQLPLMVGIHLMNEKCTLMVGPEPGYCFAANVVESDNLVKYKFDAREFIRPFNLAMALQANYMFTDRFGVDVKFDFGLTKTFKDMEFTVGKHTHKDNGHNTGIMIGVCYKFD